MLLQGSQGQTGKQIGQGLIVGTGEYSELLATELQPRYYENTYRGQTFSALASAAVTVGILTLTNVSFALYNPPNSGKNLVMTDVSFGITSTVFGTGTVVLAYNPQTSTPLGTVSGTIRNNLLTGNAPSSVASYYVSATLASTPVGVLPIFGVAAPVITTVTPAVSGQSPYNRLELSGQILVAPGGVLSVQGTVASLVVGLPGMTWMEVPI